MDQFLIRVLKVYVYLYETIRVQIPASKDTWRKYPFNPYPTSFKRISVQNFVARNDPRRANERVNRSILILADLIVCIRPRISWDSFFATCQRGSMCWIWVCVCYMYKFTCIYRVTKKHEVFELCFLSPVAKLFSYAL